MFSVFAVLSAMLMHVAAPTVHTGKTDAAAAPRKPVSPVLYQIAAVRNGASVLLRARPDGQVLADEGSRTPFGSELTFGVIARRGRWLEVSDPKLPNGRDGWVRADEKLRLSSTRFHVRVERSRRRLVLLASGRPVRAFTVGVGAPGSPTPLGRFSITDKLSGEAFSPAYGCCILALSGSQPHPPAGFTGGARLAIHGTDQPATIGQAASAGCLRASAEEMRYLLARVPLGTQVLVVR